MENDYILTSTEFARIIGTSTESLRSRRRRGMYQDQYVFRNKSYRWKRPRPSQVGATAFFRGPSSVARGTRRQSLDASGLRLATRRPKHGARNKNSGNHKRGARTNYPNKAFELSNEFKMVLKSQRKIRAADAEEITPELIKLAEEKHREKILQKMKEPFLQSDKQMQDAAIKQHNDKWLAEQDYILSRNEKLKWNDPLNPEQNQVKEKKTNPYY